MTKYVSFSLVFAPFLFAYYFPGTTVNLETIFMLFNGVLLLLYNIHNKKHITWPKFFKLFTVYSLFTPFIGYCIYGDSGAIKSTFVSYIPFCLCFLQFPQLLSFKYIKKYYRILAYCSIIFFCVQEIMYYFLGWRLMGLIPFLPVSYSYTTMSAFIAKMSVLDRSMSFFLEPAHFAQYILGYLALILGENSYKGKIFSKESIIVSVVLLMTWSGNAILITCLLWAIFILKVNINRYLKYIVIIPTIFIVASVSFTYISTSEKGAKILERSSELSVNQNRVSSGMMRIYRGYFVFSEMNEIEQLFGVGTGTIPDVVEDSPYIFMFLEFERYVNTAQAILIGDGIIGTIFFLMFLLSMTFKGNSFSILYVSLFIGLSLMEGFWLSSKMLLYLSLAYYFSQYYRNNIQVKYKLTNG